MLKLLALVFDIFTFFFHEVTKTIEAIHERILIILDSDYTLKDNFKYEGYLKLPNNKNHETYCKVICGCNISVIHVQIPFEVSVMGDCNTSNFQ